jgi:hypothetical protein
MRLLSGILLIVSLAACTNSASDQEKSTRSETPQQPAVPEGSLVLPGLPIEQLKDLWEKCDFVDYIFYDLPISMSLDRKNTIQYALSHIASEPAPIPPSCKPIGRIFYQVDGENVLESDLYFTQGCAFFVFLEDGKKKYCNYITQEGAKYLNNNIQQANAVKRQMQQQ